MKKTLSIIGALLAGFVIIVSTAIIAIPSVSQIAGIAVAQSPTLWNSVADAAKGDSLGSGVLAQSPYLYNGLTFDRQRGSIANGALVDVTRMSGSITPADTYANPTTANQVWSLNGTYNGTTWDRQRSISATNNTATTITGVAYSVPLSTWRVVNTQTGAVQATASKAAGGGTVRHVATSITVCRGDTAVAAPALVHLRDGATGAGTIIRSWVIGISTTNESKCENLPGLNETGSANTAMTLEFAAAGSATSISTVTLSGYSTP